MATLLRWHYMTAGCGFINPVTMNTLNRKQQTANFVVILQAWRISEARKQQRVSYCYTESQTCEISFGFGRLRRVSSIRPWET